MSKVLVAGDDIRLLSTRVAVLTKTGADVISCTGSETIEEVKRWRPDLVVLCHSLLQVEAGTIADEIRSCYKATKILMVLPNASYEDPLQDTRFDDTCLSNPERLIASVNELLRVRDTHSIPTMADGDSSDTVDSGLHGDYRM
ncbi:hypothetical protein [Granulicella sp. S190]|uniref:hypothetical protein n=1 Tax=Granulicella sp. S190 TaxID=1747226 RepID=UPI00131EC6B5|nr:hypothetical protein [Granulicella sp. S190]